MDSRVSTCKGPHGNETWCVREPERTVGQSLVRERREGFRSEVNRADHAQESVPYLKSNERHLRVFEQES